MSKIYLIRHGEVDNPGNILYSNLPGFHLSNKGFKQAEKAGEFLAEKARGVARVYASPLERTLETANEVVKALGKEKLSVISDVRLRDVEVFRQPPIDWDEWNDNRMKYFEMQKEGSDTEIEPIEGFRTRIESFVESIPTDRNIAIVSHKDPLVALYYALHGKDLDESFIEFDWPVAGIYAGEIDEDKNASDFELIFEPEKK